MSAGSTVCGTLSTHTSLSKHVLKEAHLAPPTPNSLYRLSLSFKGHVNNHTC